MIILLGTTILMLLFLYSWITKTPPNFPPGPPNLPVIGSVPFMPKENTHFELEKWRKKYGGVVGFTLGSQLVIAVCDVKTVREVLKRDEFQGRPINDRLKQRSFNRRIGIMFADTDETSWQEQRRFTLRHMKEFGFGKTSMESTIVDEISELIEKIRGQTVQVSGLFNLSSVNVLWSVMAGVRYKHSDPRLQNLMKILTDLFRSGNISGGDISLIFPFLRHIPLFRNKKQDVVTYELRKFFSEVIKHHKETLDENNPRDFIDVYLTEMKAQSDVKSSYDEQTLMTICTDLFSAGSESVGNSLGFALLYMVLYPEIQEKVYETIVNCIGKHRKPSLQDRSSMPYVEAVLQEIQRCNTIAPLTVPHRTFVDTTLNGYFIPKNTFVLPSLWTIMQSKEHWGDPENFRPSRFIDDKGKLIKDELMIPFGIGKRLCPGEALARNVIFLFFTSLMQEFSIQLPPGHKNPSTKCLSGFTTAPQPFEVIFSPRCG